MKIKILKALCILIGSFILLPRANLLANEEYTPISVYELKVHYKKFIGKKLNVKGYLQRDMDIGVGIMVLYPTKDDAYMSNIISSIPIWTNSKEYVEKLKIAEGSYVEMNATFKKVKYSDYSLTDIHYLRLIPIQDK